MDSSAKSGDQKKPDLRRRMSSDEPHTDLGGKNLPPEIIPKIIKRRQSIEKLQVEKVAPWMHLHDFTEEKEKELLDQMARRRASIEKLQVDKVAPWMHLHDFTDEKAEDEAQK